jgi:hypothetical protein
VPLKRSGPQTKCSLSAAIIFFTPISCELLLSSALCPLPYAPCTLRHALCVFPSCLRAMSYQLSAAFALCFALCAMPYAPCSMRPAHPRSLVGLRINF